MSPNVQFHFLSLPLSSSPPPPPLSLSYTLRRTLLLSLSSPLPVTQASSSSPSPPPPLSLDHRDPSMYTAYGPRGLYWNPASPLKLTWSELDRSNFACARSAVTSLVPLERKETQPFLGTSLKNISESVSVHELRQAGSVFWGKLFALLGETGRNNPWASSEGSFSTFPWRFLHVVNKGIKSGMMRLST